MSKYIRMKDLENLEKEHAKNIIIHLLIHALVVAAIFIILFLY